MTTRGQDAGQISHFEMRAGVLEGTVTVEFVIDELLSVVYAKSEGVAQQLQFQVIAFLSLEQKLRLLDDVFSEFDLHMVAPGLMGSLRELKKLRDLLAHGQVQPASGGMMRVTTYRRGQLRVENRPLETLVQHERSISQTLQALRRIWIWLLPERAEWFDLDTEVR